MKLVRARHWREQDGDVWKLVLSYNSLRNAYAHNLNDVELAEKLRNTLNMQIELENDAEGRKALKALPDAQQLLAAVSWISGFLGAYQKTPNS